VNEDELESEEDAEERGTSEDEAKVGSVEETDDTLSAAGTLAALLGGTSVRSRDDYEL
jgi:hypothetical protein